ncbi:MAG TPA: arylamine N-acetyltransferase [Candidatus Solibacter sp.]|nr:arylamine N-acetyltransferase [Candidatus Solibacter sp.]
MTRYLRLLGIDDVPRGLQGLRLIARRHLIRVPFENISKLLLFDREGAGRAFTLDEFLDNIERHDLGGTCYSANPHLTSLLHALGYDAELLGADMTNPDVHVCIRVNLGPGYLVDAGFAAPFREPIPLDALPYAVDEGTHHYTFDRHERGIALRFGTSLSYVAHEPPRTLDDFASVIRASFAPSAHFMNHLRIARFFDDYSIELLDRKVSVHRDGRTEERELATLEELERVVHTEFAMSRCPVRGAVAVLERLTGNSLFSESSLQPARAFTTEIDQK